ncbi:hypothetical protein Sta7437_1301 [Stanieria cyanosphaera PCC 7437]|uniref:General secretion pathway protein H n=1 Tax=Stanieria cyanosphaera (strain ATCC 29371 / PCC 7437) TaxID=111780 RepID=K9XS37_STAC7|nr:type IV pilin-like G/H family protein [Stanieria cyanosphaera]AFZ34871.1 hypothetical protein Sta7437_1301 [Stanieria cyanosphaera PCC 7437]
MTNIWIELIQLLFNFKKQRGFTLVELLVVVLLFSALSIIALPNYVNQVEKARVAEAKVNLGVLNRSQQAYYFEKATFADDMSDLGTNLSISNGLYNYSIVTPITNTEVHHLAEPILKYAGDLKIMTSAVFRVENAFLYTVCESNTIGVTPAIVNGTPITCTNGQIIQ